MDKCKFSLVSLRTSKQKNHNNQKLEVTTDKSLFVLKTQEFTVPFKQYFGYKVAVQSRRHFKRDERADWIVL